MIMSDGLEVSTELLLQNIQMCLKSMPVSAEKIQGITEESLFSADSANETQGAASKNQ